MDYYLKTTSKQAFLEDLSRVGIVISMEGGYFQNSEIIIDWIGLIPIIDENTEIPQMMGIEDFENFEEIDEFEYFQPSPILYREGLYVNIRSNNPIELHQFINTTGVYPQPPYRTFS
jgi:hypothetical protein